MVADNSVSPTHAVRTVAAGVLALVIGQLVRLPESYWAGITALAVIQSTSEAARPVAIQYFAGTAVGAAVGGWAGAHFPGNAFVFGACALIIGLACAPFRLERATFRYSSITMVIVMLVPSHSGWMQAVHRFLGVSLGIAVGLAVSALWPERLKR